MITVEYCRLMAAYNRWQNQSLIAAADGLSDRQRWADRGAFFKSIAATLNHLYWADALMLARILGDERPHDRITHSLTQPTAWPEFKALRVRRDAEIESWAKRLGGRDLAGNVAWYPPGGAGRIEMPKTLCVIQLFNHQTHHRGQVHALLTGFGAQPAPTDLPAMPKRGPGAARSGAPRPPRAP